MDTIAVLRVGKVKLIFCPLGLNNRIQNHLPILPFQTVAISILQEHATICIVCFLLALTFRRLHRNIYQAFKPFPQDGNEMYFHYQTNLTEYLVDGKS